MINVLVWTTDQGSWNGHAAMQIAADNPNKATYISFYPSSAARNEIAIDVVGSRFSPEPMPDKCYTPRAYNSLSDDMKDNWDGKKPKLRVNITGLDESKMTKVWGQRSGQWCAVSKNCATVVATLLELGSGVGPEEITIFLQKFHQRNKKRIYKKVKNDSLLNRIDNFFGFDLVNDSVTVRDRSFQWKASQKFVREQDDWSIDTFGKNAYSRMMTPIRVYNYAVGLRYLMAERAKSRAMKKKRNTGSR